MPGDRRVALNRACCRRTRQFALNGCGLAHEVSVNKVERRFERGGTMPSQDGEKVKNVSILLILRAF